MARLPLVGGAYAPRSIIANCQRCINLYPEANPAGSAVPLTHYQRPGLIPIAQGPNAPVRCLYRASNGNGYCVIGSTVYAVSSSWQLTNLGSITPGLTTPANMIDNGSTIVVVDGSPLGWTIDMSTNAFAQLVDSTGLFRGATRGDYIDSFLIFNVPGASSNEWISTLSGEVTFQDTYFAFKTAYPDPLQVLYVNNHEILLIGQLKTEVWYNGGLPTFPFLMIQGVYHEHGTVAPYSVASADISVFCLGLDLQGQGVVWRFIGYESIRISNHALEYAIMKMSKSVGISDAIGYVVQMDGHYFYVLHFPSGDQTWVYDDTIRDPNVAWHQEGWSDPATGILHRHRANCYAFFNNTNVVGDWQNGTLYAMDMDTYTDTVAGAACSIQWLRTFPHIGGGEVEFGPYGKRPIPSDGRRIQFTNFMLDLECGMAPAGADGNPPWVALRYSDDRGRTWNSDVLQTGGEPGQYLTWPTWRGLGIARDRVFEVEYSFQGSAALNGAWVEGTVLES
jgi:hypothetical protein